MNNNEIPLRIDFAGGWLDVPKLSIKDGFIVNCTFLPGVSENNWPYKFGGGLGGSAAKSIIEGMNPLQTELSNGVGWQDPAVLLERGMCVWRSGNLPVLELKRNPDFINNDIYLYWTGQPHNTADLVNLSRDYHKIKETSIMAKYAVEGTDCDLLWGSVYESYQLQLKEGMNDLPIFGSICRKYCGSGHGGYAFYVDPDIYHIAKEDLVKIELCV